MSAARRLRIASRIHASTKEWTRVGSLYLFEDADGELHRIKTRYACIGAPRAILLKLGGDKSVPKHVLASILRDAIEGKHKQGVSVIPVKDADVFSGVEPPIQDILRYFNGQVMHVQSRGGRERGNEQYAFLPRSEARQAVTWSLSDGYLKRVFGDFFGHVETVEML